MRPPSVDALARSLADTGLPHPLLVDAARAAIAAGDPELGPRRAPTSSSAALLRPVINATGVLLHTNLGRAPARPPAAARLHEPRARPRHRPAGLAARPRRPRCWPGRAAPRRRSSSTTAPPPCCSSLAALAAGRGRGREPGRAGGDRRRLPRARGAWPAVGRPPRRGGHHQPHPPGRLRARSRSPGADVALVLKVHQSNYRIVGFTEAVPTKLLSALGVPRRRRHRLGAARRRVPVAARRAAGRGWRASRPPARPSPPAPPS